MEALQTVAQVTLEQLPSSAVSEPIPGDFENVGPFYHLKVVASQSTRFSLEIGIPYPSELRGQNLFPAFLLPNNASSEGNSDEGYRWAVEPNFGMDQERVFTSTANGDEDGVIFALLKRKLASQSTTGQTVSSKEIKSVVICDPKGAPINCDEKNIEYAELPGLADKSYFEHIFTMGLESSERPIFKWAVNLVSKTFSDCTSGAQAYYQNGIIYFCVDDNSKKLVSKDHPAIMRHEMFHAVQAVWVKSFAKSIKWIIEATAELSEESPSTLSVSKDLFPRRIELGLTLNDYPNSIEYKTQDFWAYVGKKRSKKLNYLKPLLQSKLRNPLSDTDVNIGYSGGLRAAYWDFVKDQGYERTIDAHNVGSPCILAVNGKLPHLLNGTVVPEATLSMSGPEVNQPYSINSLSTRVIPIRFNNPIEQNVKITITSNSGPDLKYKVYQGTVPAASKPGCENDPEGTVLSNQKAELTKSVTDKTELVVFVANTDFQNPAIFTVTVTPINTTSISLANPYGPLTTDNRLILRGIPGKETTGQLIITNQGDIGSSMQFTTMPIGHQVVDGGVSIAGLRNPGVLDLGTANRQVWAANLFGQSTGVLRHPNDPDPANGVTSVIVPIKATCPANAWGAETSLDIVYSNGLIDDYDTPDDPSDDRPELESTTVYVYLECASKRISGHYFVSWRGDVYQWYLKTFTNVMAPGDYQVRCMPITPELKKEPIVNLNGYFDTKNRVVTETGQVWRPGIYDLEVTGEFIQPSQLLADTGETLTSPSVSGQTANKYQRRQSTYPSQSGQVQTNDSIGTSITIDEHGELWGSGRDDYGVASGSGKEYSGYKYLETKVKIPGPRDIVEVEWDGL